MAEPEIYHPHAPTDGSSASSPSHTVTTLVPDPSVKKLTRQASLERLTAVRQVLAQNSIDAYIIPTADAHNSQYIAPAHARREWVSGLRGSSGTALVTASHALVWTDARYFTQFYVEVDTTLWELMRQDARSRGRWRRRRRHRRRGRSHSPHTQPPPPPHRSESLPSRVISFVENKMGLPPPYEQTSPNPQPPPSYFGDNPPPPPGLVIPPAAPPRTTVITNPQSGPEGRRVKLGPGPTGTACPTCNNNIVTRVEYVPNNRTHIVSAALCVLAGCCCGCFVPYCMKSCKTANHYCPQCRAFVGSYTPS